MRKGVDGFRIDAIPFAFEHQDFLDEPKGSNWTNDTMDSGYYDHIYTQHQQKTYELVQSWRQLTDEESAKDGRPRYDFFSENCKL